MRRYQAFVAEGVGAAPIWQHLKSQVFLGDEDCVTPSLKQIKASGGYSYQQIGAHFGVYFTTVAKVVRRAKGG